jgi:ABC-type nitrate/sulfonate/bicarbonate transport system ATPase subunit
MREAPRVEIRSLRKRFPTPGAVIEVLDGIDLVVERRQFVTLLGPSGCGKSTMFDIIAGLEEPSSGEVLIDGTAERRAGRCGYMPQKDLLMPWKTVGDNVAVGRVAQGVARQQARSEAGQVLSRFGLGDFAGQYPRVLSGGMRQRAALARTYLAGNDLLLLDEPFGGLDSLTRLQMQSWLLDVWRQTESAVLFITHDVDEAIRLGDRVYVLTERPASVAVVLDVDLGRPRPYESVLSPQFARLKAVALRHLHTGGVDDG